MGPSIGGGGGGCGGVVEGGGGDGKGGAVGGDGGGGGGGGLKITSTVSSSTKQCSFARRQPLPVSRSCLPLRKPSNRLGSHFNGKMQCFNFVFLLMFWRSPAFQQFQRERDSAAVNASWRL